MINNIKTILIVIGIGASIWFFKDWQYQRKENNRLTENFQNQLKVDSIRYSKMELNRQEFEQYLIYQRQDLKKLLDENKIKVKQIESLISQTYQYHDTVAKVVNLQPILDAIAAKRPIKVPFKDVSECLTISGYTEFANDSLKTIINERKFDNQTDVVGYWKRKWFLGRKIATVKVIDKCGESKVVVIDKKKKK